MAPLITFRLPDVVMFEKVKSTSGRYLCFFGNHFEAGHSCWVVGVSDITDGSITMRHYNETIKDCLSPKAQASSYWEEFKQQMTGRSEHDSEEDEQSRWLESQFERADEVNKRVN